MEDVEYAVKLTPALSLWMLWMVNAPSFCCSQE